MKKNIKHTGGSRSSLTKSISLYTLIMMSALPFGARADTSVTKYFQWDADSYGNITLKTVENAVDGGLSETTTDNSTISGGTENEDVVRSFLGLTGANSYGEGGAICNSGSTSIIGDITGNFIGNSLNSGSYRYGGAIFNYSGASIGNITGNFIGNSVSSSTSVQTRGGAIYNSGSNSSIASITGDFINNYAISTGFTVYGGAVYNYGSASIAYIEGDFKGNYAVCYAGSRNAYGGAIANVNSTTYITSIVGDFADNYVYSDSGNAYGGAIYNSVDSSTDYTSNVSIGSVVGDFIGNYASSSTGKALGGAVYINTAKGSVTFATTTENIFNYGNWAGVSKDSLTAVDDENGGFMYIEKGTAYFEISESTTMTIGDGSSGYDSIAGTSNAIITKTGDGTLTVNSSMQYYTGVLNVEAGVMEVNNFLGSKTIDIDSGATLSLTISDNNILTNESLSITNDGTLKLVAGINTTANAEYAISVAGLDFDSTDGLGAIAYGGSVSGNTFTVGAVTSISSTDLSSSTEVVSAGSTIKITDSVTSSVVTISTSSAANLAITVSSARDLGEALTSIDDKEVLTAWSFTITDVDATDGVVLSFLVSDVEDTTLLQLLHRDDDSSDWEIITGGSYDADSDLYSVVVYDFCDYALVAVPEPSTYAMIFGALALGLAVYRRRK